MRRQTLAVTPAFVAIKLKVLIIIDCRHGHGVQLQKRRIKVEG